MKLYNVDTTAGEYSGCKDVNFHWFHSGKRSERRPYAQLIEGYEPTKKYVYYCEGYIDELFSEDEARQLKEYLDREHGDYDVTTVSEAELPVLDNVMGVGAMPVGGGDDFYMLSKKATYSLPFEVMGYFSLVGCEVIDGSGGFHHRLFLLPECVGKRMRKPPRRRATSMQARFDSATMLARRGVPVFPCDSARPHPRLDTRRLGGYVISWPVRRELVTQELRHHRAD